MEECVELWLMRHSVSVWNKMGVHQGQSWREPGLAPEGIKQAECMGELLQEKTVIAIWSSPLIRARQTAIIIARYQKTPWPLVIHEYGLMEITNGKIDGMALKDIKERYPEGWKKWKEKITDVAMFSGGESLEEVADRGERTIIKIARHALKLQRNLSGEKGIIIIVSHGALNSFTLAKLTGIPLAQAMETFPQENACINVLRSNGSEFFIERTNETTYLGEYGACSPSVEI